MAASSCQMLLHPFSHWDMATYVTKPNVFGTNLITINRTTNSKDNSKQKTENSKQ